MAEISLQALFATTKEKISKNLRDGISDRIPLLSEVKDSGNLKEVADGGREFSEPAITGDSQAVGAYVGTDVLDISQQEGIDKFVFTPSFIYGTVFIAGTERGMNAGDAAAVDLLEARIKQMKISKYNKLDSFLCGVQNDGGSGQKTWLGIQNIISDINTSTIPGTGIDRSLAKYANTRNQVRTTAIASATAWNTNNAGRTEMTALYRLCSFDNEKPNLCLMTGTIFDAYHLSLQTNERFIDMQRKAGGGYPHLVFMVDCKVTWGDNVLAGHFYMINSNHLKFKALKEKFFKMEDFIRIPDQDVETALCTTGGQLTTGAPRYNGVYTGAAF